MCGHVGILAKSLTEPQKKAFYDMLYLGVLRGEDSTGVAAISNAFGDKPELEVFKSVGTATNFFDDHAISVRSRNFTHKPVSVLMGHNRAATQGKVTEDNAHPFEFDNLVGAHNGTVPQSSLVDFHGYREYDIDSQIIFSHLSYTQGIEKVWKTADGAMALVWWDKMHNNLNIIRNKQRPMQYALSEDGKTLMWASELWMILVAAMRSGIKLQPAVETRTDCLYTFVTDSEGMVQCTEREVPPFVEKPRVYQYLPHYGGSNGSSTNWSYPPTPPPARPPVKNLVIREFNDNKASPSATAFTEDGELVSVQIPVACYKAAKDKILGRRGVQGHYISSQVYRSGVNASNFWCNWFDLTFVTLKGGSHILKKENEGFEIVYEKEKEEEFATWFETDRKLNEGAFTNITACGCSNCYNIPEWKDRETLLWFGREDFVCETCQNQPFIRELFAETKVG